MTNQVIENKWRNRMTKEYVCKEDMTYTKKDFVHLHLHTHLSMMDGCMHHHVMFDTLKKHGMNRVAVTNHGHMINMPKIIEDGRKQNIQVIPGAEVYMTWDYPCTIKDDEHKKTYHMVLLAMNDVGYRNLLRITSAGYTVGKYYKPRIDKEILERNSEGIIVLSACLNGVFANKIAKQNLAPETLQEDVNWFKEIFPGRFFFELQRHPNIPEQEVANRAIIQLAEANNIPLVCTADSHYATAEHFEGWQTMMILSTKGRYGHDADNDYYLKSADQMYDLFSDMPEVCEQTNKIADMCSEIHFDKSIKYPPFDTQGMTPGAFLRKISEKGLRERISKGRIDKARELEYRERMNYELKVLEEKNFSTYIAIVADYTIWAKDQGIYMSPGRGSGAGSLVCYLTKITEVDPLDKNYNLIFERFINPERNSFPDIDQDFQDDRRDEAKSYMVQKYGEDKVASILTIGTLGAKAAMKEVMRRFDVPPTEQNEFTKAVPPMIRGRAPSIKDCLENETFKAKMNEKAIYTRCVNIAMIIEGMAKSVGTHAAGLITTDGSPLTDVVAITKDKNDKIVSSDSMKVLEDMGYIKFDFLGLSTLRTIKNTIDYIKINHNVDLDYEEIQHMHDEKVYDMICNGQLAGVFQLSGSDGFAQVCRMMKPRNIAGISDINAIYRPGPLDNGFVEKYVANRKRVEKGESIHYEMEVDNPRVQKEIEKILCETYGVCLYQEQIQFIAQKVAGYTLGGADLLRRAIGKKIPEEMEKQREVFVKGCKDNDVSEESANELFNQIAKFADYCFNKSHSVAYSIIGYTTAWLKYHYPTEFFAACLTEVKKDRDKTISFISKLREEGIKLLPPDINESDLDYTPSDYGIRFGLSAIKGVGEAALAPLLKERDKGRFLSFTDFIRRTSDIKITKANIKTLISAGCLDSVIL